VQNIGLLLLLIATLFIANSVAAQTNLTSGKVIKWDQPPALANSTNIFYGWNEKSVYGDIVAADDWVCTTTNPVIKIRWWGSFIGWSNTNAAPVLPPDFRIHFWSDQPAGPGFPFSHPLSTVWQIICSNYTWDCVGQDYDPRTGTFETCFIFEQTLRPQEYFFQNPLNGTNIYWLSIAAEYPVGVPNTFPFGWKTRPRDPASPAPDAAVDIVNPNMPVFPPPVPFLNGSPILLGTNQWDLAFELVTAGQQLSAAKWEQRPDLGQTGTDVNVSGQSQVASSYLAADDFLCTSPGYITNITIWGSWLNDQLPVNAQGMPDATNVTFLISIHDDIPGTNSPTGYSMPGAIKRLFTIGPNKYTHSVLASNIQEGWLNPPAGYIFPGDTVCHQYDLRIAVQDDAFFQDGTPEFPKVFWIDVQALPTLFPAGGLSGIFGWKTSVTNWNDAAVWANGFEPFGGIWQKLLYPPTHPFANSPVNFAFRINSGGTTTDALKWSQPPVVATNPGNWFNGWNEPSIYGGGFSGNIQFTNIVADDWLCTNARPVSDIHWWGSFLNWQGAGLPTQPPTGFHFAIWTDRPVGPNDPFSHPLTVLWSAFVPLTDPTLQYRWVGWDIDPRDPCVAVESCFKFDYPLPQASWFLQPNGSNVFWISISAVYGPPGGPVGPNPFGWKTRPHVPVPPDDAVRIFEPIAPGPGITYIFGEPIEYPAGTSWDMAFRLTSCQTYPLTNVVFTNIFVTNIPGQQIITVKWNTQPGSVYQLQETIDLNPQPIVWTDLGLPVVGPTFSMTFTNSNTNFHRFYRLNLPDICP
jgi:hypothetical protein